MTTLYRITEKRTGSLQPSGTFWHREVLYCGYDRDEARQVFHENKPREYWHGYGNKVMEIEAETIEDAQTADFDDDEALEVEL